METNIREVSFSSSYTEHLYGFTQYDRGQKIKITGIHTDANTEVHFSLSASGGESPRVLPDSTGAETIVSVPDFVFFADRLDDYEAYAFVCYSGVNVGKTERRIIMHIKSRPKPADFAPPSEPDLTQKVLQELSTKLTAPSSAQIGQIFRVQSINEDETLVLEAVDMPSGGSGGAVDDVQINGQSIVGENGVAVIPIANNTTPGVISSSSNYGTQVIGSTIAPLNWTSFVDSRQNAFMGYKNLDYGVKQAMCDGKGAAWTADEQAAARVRMGVAETQWRTLLTLEALTEEVHSLVFEYDDEGNELELTDAWILAGGVAGSEVGEPYGDIGYHSAFLTDASQIRCDIVFSDGSSIYYNTQNMRFDRCHNIIINRSSGLFCSFCEYQPFPASATFSPCIYDGVRKIKKIVLTPITDTVNFAVPTINAGKCRVWLLGR